MAIMETWWTYINKWPVVWAGDISVNQNSNLTYSDDPNAIKDKWVWPIEKQIKSLEKRVKNIIDWVSNVDWEKAATWVNKPVAWYNDYDQKLANYNPWLFDLSKKVDDARQKIDDLKQQKINLEEAQKQMYGAVDNAIWQTQGSWDKQMQSIWLQKDIQTWAAQWLAWRMWASTWALSNMASQISNQFAPQSLQSQAQTQAQVAQLELEKWNIPMKLSWLSAQNIQNQSTQNNIDLQKEQMKKMYWVVNSRAFPNSKVISKTANWTSIVNDAKQEYANRQ